MSGWHPGHCAPRPADGARAAQSADLNLLVASAPSKGVIGARLGYSFQVENRGPDNTGGILTIELPPSFVRTTGESIGLAPCTGETTLVCKPALGVWEPDDTVGYFSYVRLTQAGTFTIKARVTSDVPDPDPTNNEVTITTTVTTPPAAALTATVVTRRVSLTTAKGARVTTVKAGSHAILIRDRTTLDNFHLTGPGVDARTGVPYVGNRTVKVTFRKGATYRYRSDAHPRLGGSFRAT